MRAVVSLDGEIYKNPLIGIAGNSKAYRVGTRRLWKSRTLSPSVAHVAAVAEEPLIRLEACFIRVANAKPEIAQRQQRPRIATVLCRLEMRARHRGIVAQGWLRTCWKF